MKVENCEPAFRCSQTWEKLEETARDSVRHCSECLKLVFLCRTEDEVEYHANRRHCIAFERKERIEDDVRWMVLGIFVPPKYSGPTLRLVLDATYSLGGGELDFLDRAFDLRIGEKDRRRRLCDGRPHTLKTGLPPDVAEDLGGKLDARNIAYKLEVEPERN